MREPVVSAGRAMSRTWKKTLPLPARGPLQMPGVQKPNVVEAHAMELIKSTLYLADTTGKQVSCAHSHAQVDLLSLECITHSKDNNKHDESIRRHNKTETSNIDNSSSHPNSSEQ